MYGNLQKHRAVPKSANATTIAAPAEAPWRASAVDGAHAISGQKRQRRIDFAPVTDAYKGSSQVGLIPQCFYDKLAQPLWIGSMAPESRHWRRLETGSSTSTITIHRIHRIDQDSGGTWSAQRHHVEAAPTK